MTKWRRAEFLRVVLAGVIVIALGWSAETVLDTLLDEPDHIASLVRERVTPISDSLDSDLRVSTQVEPFLTGIGQRLQRYFAFTDSSPRPNRWRRLRDSLEITAFHDSSLCYSLLAMSTGKSSEYFVQGVLRLLGEERRFWMRTSAQREDSASFVSLPTSQREDRQRIVIASEALSQSLSVHMLDSRRRMGNRRAAEISIQDFSRGARTRLFIALVTLGLCCCIGLWFILPKQLVLIRWRRHAPKH